MAFRAGSRSLTLACRALLGGCTQQNATHGAQQGLKLVSEQAAGARLFHPGVPAWEKLDVVIPALGESITDGSVAALLKAPGQRVAEDEPVVSIETDKVTVDVRAPRAGVVTQLKVEEGDTVEVGDVVAVIDTEAEAADTAGDDISEAKAEPAQAAAAAAPATTATSTSQPPAAEHAGRTPSISFPIRRTAEGAVISMLPAAEAAKALEELGESGAHGAKEEYPPTVAAAAPPPPKQGPWLQLFRDTMEIESPDPVPRTLMTEREMELIMLGGAEP